MQDRGDFSDIFGGLAFSENGGEKSARSVPGGKTFLGF
jgi:hypothetical protein